MANQSLAGRNLVRAILSIVIVFVLLVSVFATTAVAESFSRYDVVILDGASSITVTTNQQKASDVLTEAGITLGADDRLDTTSFDEGNGGVIVINRKTSIYIDFDNRISAYEAYSTNVADALIEIGVTLNSNVKINYPADAPLTNGMVIKIKSPSYVYLEDENGKTKYAISEGSVRDLIAFAGIELSDEDYTEPSLDSQLKEKMTVKLFRVEYKTERVKESLGFKTKKIKDSSMYEDQRKTLVKGVKGEADVTYEVKYINSVAQGRKRISSITTKAPKQAEVKVGTKKRKGNQSVKPNGVEEKNGFTVGQEISGRYSHYCACSRCCGKSDGRTASGKRVRNGMSNPYYIACNWLPMGSVVSIKGKNYTVVDRGGRGLSRVGRVDIFTPEGHRACFKKGVGNCTITIVRLGW